MKKRFFYLCSLTALIFGALAFTSCGDDKNDSGEGGGSGSGSGSSGFKSAIYGTWEVTGASYEHAEEMIGEKVEFNDNGSTLVMYKGAAVDINGSYSYNAASSDITMSSSLIGGQIQGTINITGKTAVMTFKDRDGSNRTVNVKKNKDFVKTIMLGQFKCTAVDNSNFQFLVGQHYVFLNDGTLIILGDPKTGTYEFSGSTLTIHPSGSDVVTGEFTMNNKTGTYRAKIGDVNVTFTFVKESNY